MYYNRKITDPFSRLIEPGGEMRWLFDFVESRDDLDFLIGKSDSGEWISVYRGLSRIIRIQPTRTRNRIKIVAAGRYLDLAGSLYGEKKTTADFQEDLQDLLEHVEKDESFDRHYANRKEGYYQNELSRRYGICGQEGDEFVIVDKEAVVGYEDQQEKNDIFGPIQTKYRELRKELSMRDAKRFGVYREKEPRGNELDFLGLDRDGNVLLIEYKHRSTAGIYLSPLQIGMYYDLFEALPWHELEQSIYQMLEQKQRIGLVSQKWPKPRVKSLIPVLIISEYNDRSSAKEKFDEVLATARETLGGDFLKALRTYRYTSSGGLAPW